MKFCIVQLRACEQKYRVGVSLPLWKLRVAQIGPVFSSSAECSAYLRSIKP